MKPRTIDDVIRSIPRGSRLKSLPAPEYVSRDGDCVGFAVRSMSQHMTDEGWHLFQGLQHSGYSLRFNGSMLIHTHPTPGTVLIQDKREWQGKTADRSGEVVYSNVDVLRDCGAFVGTVLKDAQHDSAYNRQAAEEIGCHYWVHYYHPRIVSHLSPFVRPEHLVRTYHSLDRDLVPAFSDKREGVLLSGAISAAYPLRQRLAASQQWLPELVHLKHPGYHRKGCETPSYLQLLSKFKVAICTSSRYGYAVRKIMEATAAGCLVLTDLPSDEVLPEIDGNLVRIHPDEPIPVIADLLRRMLRDWNPERQQYYADCARIHYDYRETGRRLANDIEALRRRYP